MEKLLCFLTLNHTHLSQPYIKSIDFLRDEGENKQNMLIFVSGCNTPLKLKIASCENNDIGHNNTEKMLWNIENDQDFSAYQSQLQINFANWSTQSFEDPDSVWESWKSIVLAAAIEGLGTKEVKNKCNSWFDKDIDTGIKDRRNAARVHRKWAKGDQSDKDLGDNLWKSYQDKRTYVKNLVKKKITQIRVNRSIEIANKGGPGCKDFWKLLKGNNKNRNQVNCIKIPNSSEIAYDKTKMNQTILQYWSTLGKMHLSMNDDYAIEGRVNTRNVKNMVNSFRTHSHDDEINEDTCLYDVEISMNIVLEALNLAKNNKSPGLDGITNELLKNGGNCLHQSLLAMFQKFIKLEKTPHEWNKSIIVPIFKKGDRKDLNNYRGISLTSCVAKIFNRIIAMSISKFLEKSNTLTEVQGGFRPAHRCEDHIFEGPGRIPSLKSDQSFFVSPNLAIKTVYWKVICQ